VELDVFACNLTPEEKGGSCVAQPELQAVSADGGVGFGDRLTQLDRASGASGLAGCHSGGCGWYGAHFSGIHITGRGLQVLGQWPRFEAIVSPLTFAALLDALAEYAPADEADDMKQAANAIRRVAGATLTSLALGAGGQLLRGALVIP
jgi:hypothetical protein